LATRFAPPLPAELPYRESQRRSPAFSEKPGF